MSGVLVVAPETERELDGVARRERDAFARECLMINPLVDEGASLRMLERKLFHSKQSLKPRPLDLAEE